MEMFLKSFYPSMNDLFIISIICTNIVSLFELSLATGTVFKRIGKLFICIFKYNMILLLSWIFLITIFQLQLLNNVCLVGLKVLRLCASTLMFSFLRRDILYYSQNLVIPFVVAVIMLIITAYVKKRYFAETDNEEDGDWWNFSNLRTHDYEQWWELTRLRPFDQIFNPTVGIFSMGEDGGDINHAVIPKTYIQQLPCWQYRASAVVCTCGAREPDLSCIRQSDSPAKHDQTAELQPSLHEGIANSMLDSNYTCDCNNDGHCPQHDFQGHEYQGHEHQDHKQKSQGQGQHDQHGQGHLNPYQGQGQCRCSSDAQGRLTNNHNTPKQDPFREFSSPYIVQPRTKMSHCPEGYIESHQCVICIEDYQAAVLLRGLPCGHVFHAHCIGAWLMRENHFCPVCRWPSYKPKEAHLTNSLHTE